MKKLLLVCVVFATTLFSSQDFTVYFDAGGSPGGSYTTVISNGAKAAAKDMGINLKLYYSDWMPEKMINNFKKALASNPKGVVIMGHPGDSAFSKLVAEAEKNGIAITTSDTPLPKLQSEYGAQGFGYAGTDYYTRGVALVKEAIKRSHAKKGDKALVWGLLSQGPRGLTSKAMLDELEKEGLKADYIEISDEVNKDPSLGAPIFTSYTLKHPDTKLIFIDHGGLTAQMENLSKVANIKPNDYYIAGYSLSPATLHAIRNSYVDLIGDGQPFLQGYLSIVQVVLSKKYGFSGLNIDTGAGFVDKSNIDFIAPLIKQGIR